MATVIYYATIVDYVSGTVVWSLNWTETTPGTAPYIDNTGLPQEKVGIVFTDPLTGGARGLATVSATVNGISVQANITATVPAAASICCFVQAELDGNSINLFHFDDSGSPTAIDNGTEGNNVTLAGDTEQTNATALCFSGLYTGIQTGDLLKLSLGETPPAPIPYPPVPFQYLNWNDSMVSGSYSRPDCFPINSGGTTSNFNYTPGLNAYIQNPPSTVGTVTTIWNYPADNTILLGAPSIPGSIQFIMSMSLERDLLPPTTDMRLRDINGNGWMFRLVDDGFGGTINELVTLVADTPTTILVSEEGPNWTAGVHNIYLFDDGISMNLWFDYVSFFTGPSVVPGSVALAPGMGTVQLNSSRDEKIHTYLLQGFN